MAKIDSFRRDEVRRRLPSWPEGMRRPRKVPVTMRTDDMLSHKLMARMFIRVENFKGKIDWP